MQLLEYHKRPIDGDDIIAWGIWNSFSGSQIVCAKCGKPEKEDPDPLMMSDFEPYVLIKCDNCGKMIAGF